MQHLLHSNPRHLPSGMTLLGPRFIPAAQSRFSNLYDLNSSHDPPSYASHTVRPVTIIHPLYFPELHRCPTCDGVAALKSWTAGFREVLGVTHSEYAIGPILTCSGQCKTLAAEIRKRNAQRTQGNVAMLEAFVGAGMDAGGSATEAGGSPSKKKKKRKKQAGDEKAPKLEFGMTSAEFWAPLEYFEVPGTLALSVVRH